MEMEDNLRLERYKLVTSRQAWVVDVARGVYTGYATTLAAFVAGALSLTAATDIVERLGAPTVTKILLFIAIFISCVGIVSTFQIGFCLRRWYEYRDAECHIYSAAPKPEWWAKYFEIAFVVIMGASLALVWIGYFALADIIQSMPKLS